MFFQNILKFVIFGTVLGGFNHCESSTVLSTSNDKSMELTLLHGNTLLDNDMLILKTKKDEFQLCKELKHLGRFYLYAFNKESTVVFVAYDEHVSGPYVNKPMVIGWDTATGQKKFEWTYQHEPNTSHHKRPVLYDNKIYLYEKNDMHVFDIDTLEYILGLRKHLCLAKLRILRIKNGIKGFGEVSALIFAYLLDKVW